MPSGLPLGKVNTAKPAAQMIAAVPMPAAPTPTPAPEPAVEVRATVSEPAVVETLPPSTDKMAVWKEVRSTAKRTRRAGKKERIAAAAAEKASEVSIVHPVHVSKAKASKHTKHSN
jgi:hypothetical protein